MATTCGKLQAEWKVESFPQDNARTQRWKGCNFQDI
jgi:hypothetical protein